MTDRDADSIFSQNDSQRFKDLLFRRQLSLQSARCPPNEMAIRRAKKNKRTLGPDSWRNRATVSGNDSLRPSVLDSAVSASLRLMSYTNEGEAKVENLCPYLCGKWIRLQVATIFSTNWPNPDKRALK